jgi:CRP/FNR family cyclic AMP-dependent transcriptional regulator
MAWPMARRAAEAGSAKHALSAERSSVARRDKKLDLLASVPLFAKLDRRGLERVGQLADEIDLPEGKILTRQGERGDEFFVIVDGRVKVERDGKLLAVLGSGDFIGEIALIDEGPRTATATCETDCRLILVGHREFHSLLREQPGIELTILRALAERVRRLDPATL